jgi:hypothetical protein
VAENVPDFFPFFLSGLAHKFPASRASHGVMESTVPALDTKNLCAFEKKKKGKNIYSKNYLNV